jgi:hypothetical protein
MQIITFSDISLDLSILDKYLLLTDQQLVEEDYGSLNIWQQQYDEFRFEYNFLGIYDMVEHIYYFAYNYFTEEYYCEEDIDYQRQAIYLHNLDLVRIWLRENKL